MNITVFDSRAALVDHAADLISEFVTTAPAAVLGLATGGTMMPIYENLIGRHNLGLVSFSRTSGFLLDEYVALPRSHSQTYRNVIHRLFERHVDVLPGSIIGPDGNASALAAECERYDRQVSEAGVGLQLLGIGRNGHIGFNEPGASPGSRTRVVTLAQATRDDNARFFTSPQQVPTQAITQGIGTIRAGKRLLIVAQGTHKAAAVRAAISGPITPALPASALQLHSNVTFLLDTKAASSIPPAAL